MSTIQEVIAQKGQSVLTIDRSATVLQAAELMNQHRVGAVVVMDEQRLAGIFTERDMLVRVVGQQLSPKLTLVEQVMSERVVCCRLETSVEEARVVMRNRRIRHLPVVDQEGQLQGLVSIGDLNAWHLDAQEKTIYFLNEYLFGRA
ncbi:MAG: CBS domain-containing protein [Phycisphaeraceae bacterium]|nr:CBS domain-containing protein [Phycisphaeraceae bacterium]